MANSPTLLCLEPYLALSHRLFLEELERLDACRVEVLSLPARTWKWRMGTAALHFAGVLADREPPDLLLVSDYVNLAELRGMLPAAWQETRCAVYFHENQLTYPLQEGERRDVRFALDHAQSVLAADAVAFNSAFHLRSFRSALDELLRRVPDVQLGWMLEALDARARVLPLGTDIPSQAPRQLVGDEPPIVVWNHRWEYDKAPERLVQAVEELVASDVAFRLRLLGQRFRERPAAFETLANLLGSRLDDPGFADEREDYLRSLSEGHVVLSTARHEFFGLATLEALRLGLLPVLPNDLAYPELLPGDLDDPGRFLYTPPEAGAALREALLALRSGAWNADREAIVRNTDHLTWSALAPRYEEFFEDLLATPRRTGRAHP